MDKDKAACFPSALLVDAATRGQTSLPLVQYFRSTLHCCYASLAFLTGNGLTFAHLASLATMENDCEILLLHKSLTVAQEVFEDERSEVEVDVRTHSNDKPGTTPCDVQLALKYGVRSTLLCLRLTGVFPDSTSPAVLSVGWGDSLHPSQLSRYAEQIKELVNGMAEVQAGLQGSKGAARKIPRSPSDSDLHRLGCRRTHASGRHSTSCLTEEAPRSRGEPEARRNSATFGPSTPVQITFIPSQGPKSLMPGPRDPVPTSGAPSSLKHTMQRVLHRRDVCTVPLGGHTHQTNRDWAAPADEPAPAANPGEASTLQRPPVPPSTLPLRSRALTTWETLPAKGPGSDGGVQLPQSVSQPVSTIGASLTVDGQSEEAGFSHLVQPMLDPTGIESHSTGDRHRFDAPTRPHSEPHRRLAAHQPHNVGGDSIGEYVCMVKSWSYGACPQVATAKYGDMSSGHVIGVIDHDRSYVYPIGEVDVGGGRWGTRKDVRAPVHVDVSASPAGSTIFPSSQSSPDIPSTEWAATQSMKNPWPASKPDGPLWRRAPAFVEPFLNG
eukprot:jgi/Botrbrau1/22415/Bobra.0091s0020.1